MRSQPPGEVGGAKRAPNPVKLRDRTTLPTEKTAKDHNRPLT